MKKAALLLLFIAGVAFLTLVLISFFPKYLAQLVLLVVFLVADMTLWLSVLSRVNKFGTVPRILLAVIYWLPAACLSVLVITGFIFPFLSWDVTFKSIMISLLLMTIVAKAIPLVVSLLTRLTGLVVKRLFNINPSWPGKAEVASWIAGGLLWLLLLLGMITWVYDFKVNTVDLRSARIPAGFDRFRIVQFSDVHLGNWTCRNKLKEAAGIINGLHPDLIVFTGDMFTFSTAEGKGFGPILKELKAKHGICAILGNHDYGDYVSWENSRAKQMNMQALQAFYSDLGWTLLLNRSVIMRSGNDSINIIGVENWGASRRFQRYGDITKAETGINKNLFSILLSHDPSYWDSVISRKHPEIGLTLSGHTHGGQFGIESGSLRWSILSAINPLWGGIYSTFRNGFTSTLYVNRGLGTVGYSGRVGIRPEITLIVLHSAEK